MNEKNTEEKSFDVVQAEIKDMLDGYFENYQVPFAWEAKILLDITSNAIHDQFSAHEEDIIKLHEEFETLKSEVRDLKPVE